MPQPPKKVTINGKSVTIYLAKGEILIFASSGNNPHCLCGDLNTLFKAIACKGTPRALTFKKKGDLYYFRGNRGITPNTVTSRKFKTVRPKKCWTDQEWENIIMKIGTSLELKNAYIQTRINSGSNYGEANKKYDFIIKNLIARRLIS